MPTTPPSNTKPKIWRRQYIVSPLQIKAALCALVLFGSGVLVIWLELSGELRDIQKLVTTEFQNPVLAVRLASYYQNMTVGVLFKAIFVMIIIWFVTIFVSHHFMGPIYRLKVCLKTFELGDLSCRMRLRKHDYLQDVADSFNQMAAAIDTRQKDKALRLKEAEEALSGLAQKLDPAAAEKIARAETILRELGNV